jgi:drug/metabolite transporter superfamily protein YnfA
MALLVVYAVFMLGLKGMPEGGPYAMSVGANVLDNLRAYTGLAFSVWLVLPAYGLPSGFTWSHGVWIALVVFHVARRNVRDLAFGLASFLMLLAPVLFTRGHTHSFHLYVPAIGGWFVLASAVEVVRRTMSRPALRRFDVGLAVAAVVCIAGSVVAVRNNVAATISDEIQLPRSFVLRRAVLAQRMCADIQSRQPMHESGRLVLVYPHPEAAANWRNIQSALGQGSALRLALESPDLDVVFVPPAEIPVRTGDSINVLVYNELGRCYTVPEWQGQTAPGGPGTAGPDSTRGVAPRP